MAYQPYVSPAPVTPSNTAPGATQTAEQLGQQVYQQLPGYNASLGNIGSNIQSETAGQLPPEVIAQMQQQAAERGIGTGTAGSGANNAAYLKAIGDTSLNLTQQGQQNFQSMLPSLPGGQISQNPNFYVNPGLQYQAGETNATNPAAAFNANAGAANSLAAVRSGYGTGLGAGASLPQTGFGVPQPNIDSGPYGPGGTMTAGGSGAAEIAQKYAGTVTGNLTAGGQNSPYDATADPGSPWYGLNPADYGQTNDELNAVGQGNWGDTSGGADE